MMLSSDEVRVTLSEALLARLRAEAARLGVALEYLVAGLVADTLEATP